MPKAIHVLAKDEGARIRGLTRIKESDSGEWLSGCWVQISGDPATLIDGYLYLHSTSGSRSRFGGKITGVQDCDRSEYGVEGGIQNGTAFRFIPMQECKNQLWRGPKPSGASHGGIVMADLDHE